MKPDLLQVKIFSNRLILRTIALEFQEDIFREFTGKITTYMFPRSPENISDTKLFITESLKNMIQGDEIILVILEKKSQEFLGCTGIHKLNSDSPEIGIWLKKSAHGNGYGLETVTTLKEWAEENLDYQYLIYPVDIANIPSRRIPERLGGESFREYDKTNLSGRVLHLLEYRIPKKLN
ncbi:MAG: GNAT family N-acetyltransferase [Cyanomargarita calcarea GSE-NOS-MK-12-04C]|jgi:RimJ/RimL family protein N-acetyltransferase|uniref:GNAT family N-acetyltransferase n=1 Tax=Cyanomargarita calcarea GSE-NOS-MK-12-04C TaxID=2839659 RepID=A0A951QPX7_9CYAN|nr:GNAT family N-acetyltransferase [Cyanomargarita calcarea GSE-NOS-MK-12-04C]